MDCRCLHRSTICRQLHGHFFFLLMPWLSHWTASIRTLLTSLEQKDLLRWNHHVAGMQSFSSMLKVNVKARVEHLRKLEKTVQNHLNTLHDTQFKAKTRLGTQAARFRDAAVQRSRMYIYAMNMPPSSQSVGSCCCEGTRRGNVRDSHSL
jgi:hypothetical protein